MDSMFLWMLIIAGATIGLLATFLIASERELKVKRRQIEILANKLDGSTDSNPMDETGPREPTDVATIHQLEAKNEQLQDEIGALAGKLEASENRVQVLDAKALDFSNLSQENERLRASNQELFDEINALKNQLQGNRTRDDLAQSQQQTLEDQRSALESELTRVKAELEESQARLQELQSISSELADAKSREQDTKDLYADLERRTGELTAQLAANQEKLMQFDSLQTQLQDVEKRYEEARAESRGFQEEVSRWQERSAASGETKERLEMLRRRLDELHAQQAELAEKHDDVRQGMLASTQLLDDALQRSSDSTPPIPAYESAYLPSSRPPANQNEEPSLEAAKKNIESGCLEDALQKLDRLLKDAPQDRVIKLYHLLASVRLHHANGYEKQIDAITEMANLTDTERLIARDIFLARADEAQQRGRDNEMLRYRAWAKNVIYRTPFGTSEQDPSPHVDDSHHDGGFASSGTSSSGNTDPSTPAATDGSDGTTHDKPQNGKNRGIMFTILIGLLFVAGVMSVGSLTEHKKPAVSPSVEAVQKPETSPTDGTREDIAPPSNNPATLKDESPDVRIVPKDISSPSRPSDDSRTGTVKNADAVLLASNKTQTNEPPMKETQKQSNHGPRAGATLSSQRWGAYEVVRPTKVRSEPREGSPLIANIDRGTRVNVVAARNGWFEIRSKYGRPPGFIPSGAAVPMRHN